MVFKFVRLIVVVASAFLMGVHFGQDFKRIDDRQPPKGWVFRHASIERVGRLCLRIGERGENDDGYTPIFQSGFCPKDAPIYWQPR